VGGLLFFAVGSAMCGAASNMMLVALTCFARVEGLRHITLLQDLSGRTRISRRRIWCDLESGGDRVGGLGPSLRTVRDTCAILVFSP